jgi:tetratricopeptide (TPR) repeat protein
MDKFFEKLEAISDKEDLKEAIERGRQRLERMKGNKKLGFALELSKWAERRHSPGLAEEVVDGVLDSAKEGSSEAAALLLGQKAYFDFRNAKNSEAIYYADLALKKSRDTGSNEAEAKALIIKGYLCDVRAEHKKASTWYTIALNKCGKLQEPGLLLDLGASLSKQGEYSQAWSLFKRVISLAAALSADESIHQIDRIGLKRILAEAYSRLGPVYEGIGDFAAALQVYDEALSLSTANGFTGEIYKAYSRKMKLLIMLEKFDEAEETLRKAEKVVRESGDLEPRTLLYVNHDWARLYKDSKRYQDAFAKYGELLFGDLGDGVKNDARLNLLMDSQADILSEILLGVAECLRADGRIVDAEKLYGEEVRFRELKQQTGIYAEIDKAAKLDAAKGELRTVLKRIFLQEPEIVEYKNIRAKYDYDEGKTIFWVGKKEIKRSRRYFLVFKCLVDNAGRCVSGKMMDKFLIEHGESVSEEDSGLRAYVWRLRKDIKLDQFLRPCSKSEGRGWKLRKP